MPCAAPIKALFVRVKRTSIARKNGNHHDLVKVYKNRYHENSMLHKSAKIIMVKNKKKLLLEIENTVIIA